MGQVYFGLCGSGGFYRLAFIGMKEKAILTEKFLSLVSNKNRTEGQKFEKSYVSKKINTVNYKMYMKN